MINLIKFNLIHALKSKLLVMVILFSFIVQFVSIKGLFSATLYFKGEISTLSGDKGLFILFFLQLFSGIFMSTLYGIWLAPYLHIKERSLHTFTLPVNPWLFPFSHLMTLLILVFIQFGAAFGCYFLIFGIDSIIKIDIAWRSLGLCFLLQTLAFETVMLLFTSSSLTFGPMITFVLGSLSFFMLQLGSIFFQFDWQRVNLISMEKLALINKIYQLLPPLGELIFDLKKMLSGEPTLLKSFMTWFLWLLIGVILFRLRLKYPGQGVKTDT